MNDKEIVVLFSGGTDSTLTAALMAKNFDKVHLVTYDRFGFFAIKNSTVNFEKLKNKYGAKKFTHKIINIDKLSKHVFYEHYINNFVKYGFFLLSTCGLCKLAMHIRSIVFCLDNNIANICDGANKGMNLFPAQMKRVIDEMKDMYADFGIKYMNPVFDLEGPQDLEFSDRLHLDRFLKDKKKAEHDSKEKPMTAGCKLFELGIMPSDNVKGTELDRKMQPRCFQFILFNIFILWYYLHDHTYEQYEEITHNFYKNKIENFMKLLKDYVKNGQKSTISNLVKR